QFYNLLGELSALENAMILALLLRKPSAEAREIAAAALAEVGPADRLHHRPGELSGGEQQRVAVARALINGPKLILADEPTGNLDEHTGDSVIQVLLGICAEFRTALVLVTHNALHAGKTGRKLFLHDGVLSDVQGITTTAEK